MTLILSGCMVPQSIQINAPFNEEQARKQLEKGNSSITGEAFLKKRDGGVVTCAGELVRLIPATDYAKERLAHIYGSYEQSYRSFMIPAYQFEPNINSYDELQKVTRCNSLGHFEFNNIKNGEYFVITRVIWGPIGNSVYPEGGTIQYKIQVKDKNEHIVMGH